MAYMCTLSLLATLVEIGLERTSYTAHDNANYQIVCANVESGSIGGRNIEISYTVEDNGTLLRFFLMSSKTKYTKSGRI